MFNKVILLGNIVRDIDFRYVLDNLACSSTALVVSRTITKDGEKKEEVCYIDITFFGRSAEIANQYLRKGSKILIEGKLKFDKWTDQNGNPRSKHSVVVETMEMLSDNKYPKNTKSGNPYDNYPQRQTNNMQQSKTQKQNFYNNSRQDNGQDNVPVIDISENEEELPF